ncbi:hypothetical protein DVH24_007029 [Malus domestica]|uniref:Uncharacterized protein n=1 Tax=Malus domestica TaxID=3750 RepID=A0A498HLG1_MALDO|nr:hypothetical protein DVH24_007029 [Malus domestica]
MGFYLLGWNCIGRMEMGFGHTITHREESPADYGEMRADKMERVRAANFDSGRDGCASGGWGRTEGLAYWREMGRGRHGCVQFVGLADREGVTEGGMGDFEGLTDCKEMGARGGLVHRQSIVFSGRKVQSCCILRLTPLCLCLCDSGFCSAIFSSQRNLIASSFSISKLLAAIKSAPTTGGVNNPNHYRHGTIALCTLRMEDPPENSIEDIELKT